jgi:predicted PilT family ATPase
MIHEIIIHAPEFQNESAYIRTEVESNLAGKLDAYIRRTAKEWDKVRAELTLIRDKVGTTGKLEVSFPGNAYRSSRDNYTKLDDLINHLFVHIKEQMGK